MEGQSVDLKQLIKRGLAKKSPTMTMHKTGKEEKIKKPTNQAETGIPKNKETN